MGEPTFSDYYRNALEKVKQDILREADTQILGSEVDDLANYFYQKYTLELISFDPESLSYEIKKEIRRVPARQREDIYRGEGDIDWEYEVLIISIPIQPHRNLGWIKQLGTGSWSSDGFEDDINYEHDQVSYRFDTKGYGFQFNEDTIANQVNSKSERLLKNLNDKNENINRENNSFLSAIKELISQRKAKLLADKDKLDSLTQKIRIPIKQKTPAQATKISIDVKNFVHAVKPTPKLPEEYTLEEAILKDLLEYVDNQCQSFERTPSSYKQLGEEQLRDIILAALNGIFQGSATGETFIKKGKSDIHLRIEKGEILIFECKIWGGEKLYLETVDQLIGYVTWRQNYGVVIMFCKNKDFSKILTQIPDIIQKHPRYVKGYKKINDSHFVSEHSLPEDEGKIIKIHHLIYNLYSE